MQILKKMKQNLGFSEYILNEIKTGMLQKQYTFGYNNLKKYR